MDTKNEFYGPLFIVGFGRSGTKLLRTILNKNKNINILQRETAFIPRFYNRYYNNGEILAEENIIRLYKSLTKTTFFNSMNKKNNLKLDISFLLSIENPSFQNIIEVILKFYIDNNKVNFIWGDKTPNYLKNIKVLKNIFPEAKFIHIIRDPRDVAISYNKTWNKSIYYTAYKWKKSMDLFFREKIKFSNDICEIYYEKLLIDPKTEISKICKFLNVEFVEDMVLGINSTEKYGNIKNQTGIITTNTSNYLKLKTNQIKRLEEITFPYLIKLKYEAQYAKNYKKYNIIFSPLIKLTDFINYWHHIIFKEEKFFYGVKRLTNYFIYRG